MSRLLTLGLLGLLLCPLPRLHAQASYTQLQPTDSGYGPLDQSTPSMPPDQIIQKFAAKESEFRQAMGQYTYTRSVKIETLNDDGSRTASISRSPTSPMTARAPSSSTSPSPRPILSSASS